MTYKIKIQCFSLAIAVILLIIKSAAFWLTKSNAILSDAAESIVNVLTAGFGLYSLYLAAKPKDKDHPYGHGKIEYISGGLEGGLMSLAGILIIGKALYNFYRPQTLNQIDIGIIVVALSTIINFGMGHISERVGKQNQSLVLIANGKHMKSDAYSTIGILIGLGLVLATDLIWIDNLVALLTGIFIVTMGFKIVRKAQAGIMDETDFELVEKVVNHLSKNRKEDWIDIHNLRIIKYGDSIHVDCHATIPWYYNIKESHDLVEDIELNINNILNNKLESFIHLDPCNSNSCSICKMANCPERSANFQKKVNWTLENVIQNTKHNLTSN